MAEHKPGFFARWRANYQKRMQSPEMKRRRRIASYQIVCLLLVGLPVGLLAVRICQSLDFDKHVYVPVVTATLLLAGRAAGRYLADRRSSKPI